MSYLREEVESLPDGLYWIEWEEATTRSTLKEDVRVVEKNTGVYKKSGGFFCSYELGEYFHASWIRPFFDESGKPASHAVVIEECEEVLPIPVSLWSRLDMSEVPQSVSKIEEWLTCHVHAKGWGEK